MILLSSCSVFWGGGGLIRQTGKLQHEKQTKADWSQACEVRWFRCEGHKAAIRGRVVWSLPGARGPLSLRGVESI